MCNKTRREFFTPIISFTIILFILCSSIFIHKINQTLVHEVESSLLVISTQNVTAISDKLLSRLEVLESLASLDIITDPYTSGIQKLNYLRSQVDKDYCSSIGLVDLKGNVITTDNHSFSIKDSDYFLKAIKGYANVSFPIIPKADNIHTIIYSVPVIYQNKITGVLYASISLTHLTDFLTSHNQTGFTSYIVKSDGTIIATSDPSKNIDKNFFKLLDIKDRQNAMQEFTQSLSGQTSNISLYKLRDRTNYITCLSIPDMDNWYLISAVPQSTILNNSRQIIFFTGIGTMFICFTVVMLGFILLTLRKKYISERQLFNFAIDSAELYTITLSKKGTFLSANDYFLKQLGTSLKELIGQPLTNFSKYDINELLKHLIQRKSFELCFTNESDKVFYVYWHNITINQSPSGTYQLVGSDITLKKQHDEQIHHLAYYDSLTSLPNRTYILEEISHRLSLLNTTYGMGALISLDINNFKGINNTFGHKFGDDALIQIANRLCTLQNKNTIVSRFGSDNFILIQDNILTEQDALSLGEQIVSLFQKPFTVYDNSFHVTCSIGIVIFNDKANSVDITPSNILTYAELAIAKAKTSENTQYILFDSNLSSAFLRETDLNSILKQALKRDEFTLYYQPQYNIHTKKVIGFEALLRWFTPTYGMVSPAEFIPLAEKNGVITEITRWVIDQSFQFAKSLESMNIHISCNISAIDLLQTDFVDYVITKFKQYNILPGSIILEITETCLIESFDKVCSKLEILKNLGIQIHLDDFGTGYSSLTYLRTLPIHAIKVDKAFIDHIVSDKMSQRIIKIIMQLASELNVDVIVEGIETQDQIAYIPNCEIIQGYLISKPVPKEDAVNFAINKNR